MGAKIKIMVCLISDQHVPNLLTVHAIEPDILILIETPGMKIKKGASNFIRALRMGTSRKPKCRIKTLTEENSIEAMGKLLENLFLEYRDAEWTVNITGGTKPMSIGAFEFFKNNTASILYVPIVSQSRAIDFSNGKFVDLEYKLNIKEFLAGYGFNYLKSDETILRDEKQANKLLELATNLSSNIDIAHKIMNDLDISFMETYGKDLEVARKRARNKGTTLTNFKVLDQRVRNLLSLVFDLQNDGLILNGTLKHQAIKFLTGGWLEVFIWGILSKYSNELDLSDVRLGPHPGKKSDKKDSKNKVMNDWDIAFMHGQSLRFVECKTGDQKHDTTGNETLYRIEAVKKQLGALNIKSYLATTAPNILESGEIKETISDRARLYNCTIIPGRDISKIAEMELKRDPLIVQTICDLFSLKKVHSK